MEISDEEVRALSAAIQKRYGVDFTCYEIKSLKRRIVRVMNVFKMEGVFDLWDRVLKDPSFVEDFTNEISVGLTSMFRDPDLWIYLKDYIRGKKLTRGDDFKVWHAGCSTGEEVYTMGIVLSETGTNDIVKAVATDMNTNSIEQALSGIYRGATLDDYSKNFKLYNKFSDFSKYYTKQPNGDYKLHPELIKHVEFKEHNLVTDSYESGFDIIFCRNVLIYFDAATKLRILKQFHENMKDDAILIIGFFDSFIPFVKDNLFSYLSTDVRVLGKNIDK